MRLTIPNFDSVRALPAGTYRAILEKIEEPRTNRKQDGSEQVVTDFTFSLPPQENVGDTRKFMPAVFGADRLYTHLSSMKADIDEYGNADITNLINREFALSIAQSEDGSKNYLNKIVPID